MTWQIGMHLLSTSAVHLAEGVLLGGAGLATTSRLDLSVEHVVGVDTLSLTRLFNEQCSYLAA